MYVNGKIQFGITSKGAVNVYGEPVDSELCWGQEIPCLIKANSDSRQGKYVDGHFRQASYVVLIESKDIPVDTQRVRLRRYAEPLGEHPIIEIVPLLTLGRIRITV